MIRPAAVVLTMFAALGGTVPIARPAAAVEGCNGVLVVVEPRSVPDTPGYGVRTGCAANPDSGIQALQQAGFAVRLGTGPYAGGFVCALDGAPKAGCGAVTNTRSWSYWYMLPGTDTWVNSQVGANNRTPPKGSIEGWVWQDGALQPPSPRSAIVPTPAPSATPVAAPPPTTPQGNYGGAYPVGSPARATGTGQPAGGAAPPLQGSDSAPAAGPSGSPASTADLTSTGPAPSPLDFPSPSAPTAAPAKQAVDVRAHSGGSWWPQAVGTIAVAALIGATLWRRRQRSAQELP